MPREKDIIENTFSLRLEKATQKAKGMSRGKEYRKRWDLFGGSLPTSGGVEEDGTSISALSITFVSSNGKNIVNKRRGMHCKRKPSSPLLPPQTKKEKR